MTSWRKVLVQWLPIMTSWSKVLVRWLPIMTSWRKDKQSWMLSILTSSVPWLKVRLRQEMVSLGCWGKHAHIPDNDYWGICLFHVVWTNLFFAIILMWYTRNIFLTLFIGWTLCMSDNLPERVQILGHAHILCITVRENRIICCQIFCDLLLKSAFERIFNVMQLILVKIKWKYLIQKFHDICLSYLIL
jgi:hypothetical protein